MPGTVPLRNGLVFCDRPLSGVWPGDSVAGPGFVTFWFAAEVACSATPDCVGFVLSGVVVAGRVFSRCRRPEVGEPSRGLFPLSRVVEGRVARSVAAVPSPVVPGWEAVRVLPALAVGLPVGSDGEVVSPVRRPPDLGVDPGSEASAFVLGIGVEDSAGAGPSLFAVVCGRVLGVGVAGVEVGLFLGATGGPSLCGTDGGAVSEVDLTPPLGVPVRTVEDAGVVLLPPFWPWFWVCAGGVLKLRLGGGETKVSLPDFSPPRSPLRVVVSDQESDRSGPE
jgi:hypothetical protein